MDWSYGARPRRGTFRPLVVASRVPVDEWLVSGCLIWSPWASFDRHWRDYKGRARRLREGGSGNEDETCEARKGKRSTRSVERGLRLYIRIQV